MIRWGDRNGEKCGGCRDLGPHTYNSACEYGNGHRTTDPACRFYRNPVGWWARRRFNRARGRACRVCYPDEMSLECLAWVAETLGEEARLVLSAEDLVRLEMARKAGELS